MFWFLDMTAIILELKKVVMCWYIHALLFTWIAIVNAGIMFINMSDINWVIWLEMQGQNLNKFIHWLTIALVLFSWILPTLIFAPILHYFFLFRSLFQKCFSHGGWCYSQKVWFPFCLFFEHVNYPGAANMIFMALKQIFGMI